MEAVPAKEVPNTVTSLELIEADDAGAVHACRVRLGKVEDWHPLQQLWWHATSLIGHFCSWLPWTGAHRRREAGADGSQENSEPCPELPPRTVAPLW